MDEGRPLVLATRSGGKLRELRAMCGAAGIATESLDDAGIAESAEEAGIEVYDTFEENAEAKARYFAVRLPGRVVLAEDSGLVVDALGGGPGVRSKRWAGVSAEGEALDAANNAALIRALEGVPQRSAHYVCVAVIVDGERTWRATGSVEGRITQVPRGIGGFGYDPFFESVELGCTFAEASVAEKAAVSHRGRAVREVLRLAQAGGRLRGVVSGES